MNFVQIYPKFDEFAEESEANLSRLHLEHGHFTESESVILG